MNVKITGPKSNAKEVDSITEESSSHCGCPCVGHIKRMYDYYAFTIRKTMKKGGEPTAVSYVDFWLDHEKRKGFETDVMKFEYTGGCHAHGIIKFDRACPTHISANPQKYLSQRGWHIYIKPLTNREIWINYISKEEKHITRSQCLFNAWAEDSGKQLKD